MTPRFLSAFSMVAILALGACAEEPTAPETSSPRAIEVPGAFLSAADLDGTTLPGRYVVSFNGSSVRAMGVKVERLGGTLEWVSSGAGLAAVSGIDAAGAAELGKIKGVSAVDADVAVSLDLPAMDAALEVAAGGTESQSNPAGSFFYARQWNMRAVGADVAWAAGALGSSSVSVFILDSGIDYLYPDVNGLVDQSRSINLLGTFNVGGVPFTEADTVAKYFPGRAAYTDLYFHGTHVAATVSSLGLAAAGVTSKTTLVAVKVCSYLNICPTSAILGGVIYAADNGADVMNLSLGGSFAKAGNGKFIGLVNKTYNYARSKGTTVVVSAGNSAIDLDHDGNSYKSYCSTPATVCVSATGPTYRASVNGPFTDVDAPAYYTNYGRSAINVAAPGGNSGINSNFVYAACSQTSLVIPVCQTGIYIVGAQGTSMAAPHVSGAAALLVAAGASNPAQVRAALQNTADDLGQPGTDPFYGKGRLNVARAVGAIP
jgi:subtilisin family serine protease